MKHKELNTYMIPIHSKNFDVLGFTDLTFLKFQNGEVICQNYW